MIHKKLQILQKKILDILDLVLALITFEGRTNKGH